MSFVLLHLPQQLVPVAGNLVIIGLLAAALARRSRENARAALGRDVLLAVVVIVVMCSVRSMEGLLERRIGVGDDLAERYEEALLVVATALVAPTATAAGPFAAHRPHTLARWDAGLGASLAASVLVRWLTDLGGRTRPDGLRPGPAATGITATEGARPARPGDR